MSKLVRYLILRPLLTNIILVVILILTGASLLRIKRQGMPRVDLGQMDIITTFPGASPEDVELNVTVKIEEALKGVDGIEKYTSRSMENVSYIQLSIDQDAENHEKVKSEVRRAVEGVTDLPEEVTERPDIQERKTDNRAAYEVALTIKDVTKLTPENERLLRYHARDLKRKLLDLSYVSKVYEQGIREREIQILLNPEKMTRHYVSFDEVIQSIQLNKLRVSGGSLESYTSEKGIVTLSEFSDPKDVENIIIRSGFLGGKVRIKDVGRVVDDFKKLDLVLKYGSKPGVSLQVVKKGTADVVVAVDRIKEVIEEYKQSRAPPEIEFHSSWDDSIETRNRLSLLYGNAAMGLLLVLLVLFIFFDPKIAFWTALGIPISVGITLSLLPIFGITLNSISLLGMVVVLGMIVDDAIIIAESIYVSRERGLSAQAAALEGLNTVIKPVFGTIITTMIAFAPIYLLPGVVGAFSAEIPSIVIIMLAASFFEATTILPAHLGHEKKRKQKRLNPPGDENSKNEEGEAEQGEETRKRRPPGQGVIETLELLYERLLTFALGRRYLFLVGSILFLLITGFIGIKLVRINMFPNDQAFVMWFIAETPRGSSLAHTNRESEKLEKIIADLPGDVVQAYKSMIGQTYDPSTDTTQQSAGAFLTNLILIPANDREQSAEDIKKHIIAELKKVDPEGLIKLDIFILGGGPPVGRPLELQILGQDNKKRFELQKQLQEDLKEMGIIEVESDYRQGKEEIRLLPNYDTVAAARLNVASIARTIRTAFDGAIVTHLQTPDERIAFRVILDRKFRDFKKPLENLYVRNQAGQLAPLRALVKESRGRGAEAVNHYNSYRSTKITGNVDPATLSLEKAYLLIKEKYKDFEKQNPGFKLELAGEAEKGAEFQRNMIISMLAAVFIIYLLMVVQFNSFFQPAMVILAIPYGLLGIFIAFGLQGLEISMLALIGILGFMGVVINDSLIMVDFINRLRRYGSLQAVSEPAEDEESGRRNLSEAEFLKAVIQGARARLRPITLTTLTTVAGLIPTAYGFIGGYDAFVSPMVMAMTWGLLTGTLSVLIVIPLFYSVFADLGNILTRTLSGKKETSDEDHTPDETLAENS